MVVVARDVSSRSESLLPPRIPRHIAIIMDGNGRWAKARGLPRTEGHRQGTENLRRIIRACVEFGVEILTIYAFSTENWQRPPLEVRLLMSILEMVLDRELQELHSNGVQIRHIGKLDQVAPHLQRKIRQACEYTRDNRRLILNVAFNYGGRDEIVHAVREIVRAGVPADQYFAMNQAYDDGEWQRLLAAACEKLGVTPEQAEEAFAAEGITKEVLVEALRIVKRRRAAARQAAEHVRWRRTDRRRLSARRQGGGTNGSTRRQRTGRWSRGGVGGCHRLAAS